MKLSVAWFTMVMGCAAAFGAASCSSKGSDTASADSCSSVKVDGFKELVIVEPSVVGDARSMNATSGAWSFRAMIENMTPPGKASGDFVMEWLRTWIDETEYNGEPLDLPNERRNETMMNLILCPWMKQTASNACDTNCGQCAAHELDMAKAPFRLIAISNRMDLRLEPRLTTPAPNGEGRLVYALTYGPADDPASKPAPMTVIFEYALPTSMNVKQWASAWHDLGKHDAFDDAYKADLETLTNRFTKRGAAPDRTLGSAISQIRTNESVLNWIWQLREFELASSGRLQNRGTANTPFGGLNGSETLAKWANENAATIQTGKFTVPVSFLGGSADQFLFTWTLPGVEETTRRAFAKQTCSGCHTGDPPGQSHRDVAFHVSPFGQGAERLSPFVYDPTHTQLGPGEKDQITVRTEDMQSALCSP